MKRLLLLCSLTLIACGGAGSDTTTPQQPVVQIAQSNQANGESPAMVMPLEPPSVAPPSLAVPIPPPGPAPLPPGIKTGELAQLDKSNKSQAPELRRETWVASVEQVTDMAVASTGLLIYAERQRGLAMLSTSARLLGPDITTKAGEALGGAGTRYLALTMDPAFTANRQVFFTLRSPSKAGAVDTVHRAVVDIDRGELRERVLIASVPASLPAVPADPQAKAGPSNDPSPALLRFAADGALWVGSGTELLALNREGAPFNATTTLPPATAAPRDARAAALGFREPGAVAIRWGLGQVFVGHRGNGSTAELAVARPSPGVVVAQRAVWSSATTAAPFGGLAFASGVSWKAWNGALMAAQPGQTGLAVFTLDADGAVMGRATTLSETATSFATITAAPSDALVVATHGRKGGDQIWRLVAQ